MTPAEIVESLLFRTGERFEEVVTLGDYGFAFGCGEKTWISPL